MNQTISDRLKKLRLHLRFIGSLEWLTPGRALCVLLIAAFLLPAGVILSIQLFRQDSEIDDLRAQLRTYRMLNRRYKDASSDVQVKLGDLESITRGLTERAGLVDLKTGEFVGGVGGAFEDENPLRMNGTSPNGLPFTQLAQGADDLERSLKILEEHYKQNFPLMSYTPSIVPVRGWISSSFGYRMDPNSGKQRFHPAIDIATNYGTDVRASADGQVVFAGRSGDYGNLVIVDHKFGYKTKYGHLSKILVKRRQQIHRGELIGRVGSSGNSTAPHVHYEVRFHDKPVNPMNYIIDLS